MPSRPGRVVVFFDKRTRLELVLQHNGLALASLPGGTPQWHALIYFSTDRNAPNPVKMANEVRLKASFSNSLIYGSSRHHSTEMSISLSR